MYPPVNPVIIQLGPLSLHWYGLILTLGIFVGTYVASRYVTRHGHDGGNIWDMLLWVLIPALLGARLYYVFIQSPRGPDGLDRYLANPIEIVQIWRGGIHIFGAFILGGIALLLYIRWRKLPILLYADAVALGLLIGQAIGRLANFINQELYGPPTTLPWGLHIDQAHRYPAYSNMTLYPESTLFQPLFLYESLWNALGFALFFWISRRFGHRLRDGDLFLGYLIWYPFIRFWLEFMRSDSWFFPGTPFNPVHLLSAITIIAAASILFLRHRSNTSQQVQSSPATAAESDSPLTIGVPTEATPEGSEQREEEGSGKLAEDTNSASTDESKSNKPKEPGSPAVEREKN
jgi:phosphatidylglycerol:prolipoprotein diacylglycerol transferase